MLRACRGILILVLADTGKSMVCKDRNPMQLVQHVKPNLEVGHNRCKSCDLQVVLGRCLCLQLLIFQALIHAECLAGMLDEPGLLAPQIFRDFWGAHLQLLARAAKNRRIGIAFVDPATTAKLAASG